MAIYSKHDLDTKGNDGTTLREHIENSQDEFGLTPIDLDKMTDAALTEYVEFIDDRHSWKNSNEDRKGW